MRAANAAIRARFGVMVASYIPTWAGFLYLAVVLDVFSRRVIGWSMANHLRTRLVLDALDMALWQRRPNAVVHHSDQGSQYTSIAFGNRCRVAAGLDRAREQGTKSGRPFGRPAIPAKTRDAILAARASGLSIRRPPRRRALASVKLTPLLKRPRRTPSPSRCASENAHRRRRRCALPFALNGVVHSRSA